MIKRLLGGAILAFVSVVYLSGQSQLAKPTAPAARPASPQATAAPRPPAVESKTAAVDAAIPRKVMDQYCVTCHNAKTKSADLLLDQLDLAHIGDHPEIGEKVVRKLRAGLMPPTGMPRPDAPAMESFIRWMEDQLDRGAETHLPAPGLHRLNRTEYTNAIRDLLALKIDGESLLIADEPDKHGFENIAGLLSVSPSRLERYLAAARKVSRLAVGDPTINPTVETYTIPAGLVQDDRVSEDLPFGTQGGISINHSFPIDAEYSIKILLQRQVYLYILGMGEAHELDVRIDGVRVKRFSVGGEGKG